MKIQNPNDCIVFNTLNWLNSNIQMYTQRERERERERERFQSFVIFHKLMLSVNLTF